MAHHRARSGRTRHLHPGRFALWTLASVAVAAGVTALSVLYTPTLHLLAGDWTGQATDRYLEKYWRDSVAAIVNVVAAPEPDLAELRLPAMDLRVEKNAFDSLDRDIIRFGFGALDEKPRVDGRSRVAGSSLPVSIRYRGTNSWHHQRWKPSLRVRYKRHRIVDGRRDHVLIAPEDGIGMRNWLSAELARRWGVMSNRERFELLFVNRKFFGLYTNSWRFDESLLIAEGRLPGPFFRLENHTGPAFRREAAAFADPATWEIIGAEPGEGREVIEVLLEVMRRRDAPERLGEVVDGAVLARYLALLAHAASVHVASHNVALWLDTTSGLLEPVIIDANGYDWSHPGMGALRPTQTAFPLARAWLRDPRNLALYAAALYELLDTIGAPDAVEELLRAQWRIIRPYVVSDVYFSEMGASNGTFTRSLLPVTSADSNLESLIDAVRKRANHLRALLEGTRVFVQRDGERFLAQVIGYAGVDASRIDGATFSASGVEVGASTALLPVTAEPNAPAAAFWLPGAPEEYRFTHRLTGQTVPGADGFHVRRQGKVFPPVAPPEPAVVGPGTVRWNEDRSFEPGQRVVFEPGTRLELGAGVSVYVRGPLVMRGTELEPILVRPVDPARAFGVFAILGPGCTADVQHADVEGGSVARRLNLSLSGMFSIRDCERFEIADSRFARNEVGDDTLHVVRSTGNVRRSSFESANSDAIDWDRVHGEISGSTFRSSGNDGVDLSMSTATLDGNVFEGCGDKCVSIGEGSTVHMRTQSMRDCALGIAVKDRSRATLVDSLVESCVKALNVYRKKWRWAEGGTLYVARTRVEGSIETDVEGDATSRLVADDTSTWKVTGELRTETGARAGWPAWARP